MPFAALGCCVKESQNTMKNLQLLFTIMIISLSSVPLTAKEYDNILLYKQTGTWKSNAPIIQSGYDAERIEWNGTKLTFTPHKELFDLASFQGFGFAIRVPEEMKNQPIRVTFFYDEWKPVIWDLRTPPHIGWRGACIRIRNNQWPYLRQGKIKTVEFSTEVPDFHAVLDDIRFVPTHLNYDFEEAWVPPVTSGCFFPEYTLEQVKMDTLNDPDFKAKMGEIEQLRQNKLKIQLKPQQTTPENLQGIPEIARIHPDGSVDGLSYEDAVEIQNQRHFWHESINEIVIQESCSFFQQILTRWEWGRVPRTEENRKKLFKSLIRTLTAESNRREELPRFIVPAFLMPSAAAKAYRVFFDEMDAVEKGTNHDPDAILLNRLLKEAVSWCYFHTFYSNVAPALTIESFSGCFSDVTGGNFSYRPTFWAALICRNPKMLDTISAVAKGSLSLNSYNTMKTAFWLDGMTADGSAWGHKNQNYPFGYPMDGFLGIGELIGNLSGSLWALNTDDPAFNTICNYLEALLWHGTGWKDNNNTTQLNATLQRDIPVACGRGGQLYNEGAGYNDFTKSLKTLQGFLALMPEGSKQQKQLQHCADVFTGKVQQLPTGTRYFWNNDLLLCREKESLVSISMLSSRVLSIECAPSDSHFTDFWSDGAAWIMKHFDSYRIARGFMKPCAIPGVTSRQWEFTHTESKWRSYTGLYSFAGGATDGNYAVCGYQMERKKPNSSSPDPNFFDLTARKAYFWLNGTLVCIGAGITDASKRDVPVATTIDQTLWRSQAIFSSNNSQQPGETFKTESQMLWHDGVGYWIINGRGVLSGETRNDRWLDFDIRNKKAQNLPKTAPMLMFQIDHGRNPQDDSYAYAVDFHCKDFFSLEANLQSPSFEILSMTPDLQALRESSSGVLAAVFYKPGEIGGLKVNAPAVILLHRSADGKVRVTVNDPLQNPKATSLILEWENKLHDIQLPTGVYCGQPVTIELSEEKHR